MKKLLIVIPWTRYYVGNRDCPFASSPERAPEGVVGLATYLISKGADVRIADTLYMLRLNDGDTDATLTQLWETCADFKPDVIGFSFFTARFECAAQIFDDLRLRYAHSDTSRQPMFIAGGVHPTLLPQVTLQYMPLDAVVVGEGELPLLELLGGKHPREIKGIFMPGDVHVEKANVVECLDDLPVPDWSLIDIDHYTQPSYQISNTRLLRTMPVTFGRGCLYRCNFCAHNCFLRARHHSANYFVAKMRQVAQQCGIDTFVVQDSSIGNFSDEWAEVCRQLIAMDSPFRWWANLRANQANRRLLQLMKQAGCIKLFFGFESGSPRILKRMSKRITVEQCRQAAELCHEVGIPFYTSYIINYFGEEESDLQLTEELIRQTQPTSLSVNTFSPIPGSADYESHTQMIKPYINTIHDWTRLGMLAAPLRFGNMPEERFDYWRTRLRSLKQEINSHETAPEP